MLPRTVRFTGKQLRKNRQLDPTRHFDRRWWKSHDQCRKRKGFFFK